MQTLTYGLQNPKNGDKGSIFFPALNDNFVQLDAHNHDGVTSKKLNNTSMTNLTQAIDKANWVAVGDGTGRYSQVLVMPNSMQYDEKGIIFRNAANKDPLYLDYEKVAGNSYRVFINDNTIDLTAIFQ